jgi:hypothetical protein
MYQWVREKGLNQLGRLTATSLGASRFQKLCGKKPWLENLRQRAITTNGISNYKI